MISDTRKNCQNKAHFLINLAILTFVEIFNNLDFFLKILIILLFYCFLQFFTIVTFLTILISFFFTVFTIIYDNFCDLTIKSDTEQHSQCLKIVFSKRSCQ